MIERDIENRVLELAQSFRALLVTGPRQSGKSTLVRKIFSKKPYHSLENLDTRELASGDPRLFLSRLPDGAILDEVQRCPELLNYLQGVLDDTKDDGLFILTGSNNILVMEAVTQSLAGRIGFAELLPLTLAEIKRFGQPVQSLDERVRYGGFPEIFDRNRNPYEWSAAYARTYIERDVRLIRSIEDAVTFTRFIQLCAGRVGQQLNYNALALEAGIDQRTAKAWLSLLEQTFVIHLLRPYHRNYNKRIVKSPKLYFHDTALASYFLGIKNEQEMSLSHFRGALVENYVLNEIKRHITNLSIQCELFYWRDHKGLEVDLIIDSGSAQSILPVEIKAGSTYQSSMTKALRAFMGTAKLTKGVLLYNGDIRSATQGIEVIPTEKLTSIFEINK